MTDNDSPEPGAEQEKEKLLVTKPVGHQILGCRIKESGQEKS